MSTESSATDPAPPDPTPAAPTPALSPSPSGDTTPNITPIVGPLSMLLRSRKGVVLLVTVAFCVVVYLRDPSKFDKLASFLSYVLTVWFGSHAWQESRSSSEDKS